MKAKHILKKHEACKEAFRWVGQKTIEEAWQTCHRADWMLWMAVKLKVNEKTLLLTKSVIAHQVIHLMTDKRSRNAVRIAFLYGRSKASKQELEEAADAVYADDATYYADDAAAYAASVADADSVAVYAAYAASIADATYYDNDVDDADDADPYITSLKKSADICRKLLTYDVLKKCTL